jgi:hypothetical protein
LPLVVDMPSCRSVVKLTRTVSYQSPLGPSRCTSMLNVAAHARENGGTSQNSATALDNVKVSKCGGGHLATLVDPASL